MAKFFPPVMFTAAAVSLLTLGGCVIVAADKHVTADWDIDKEYSVLKGAEVSADTVTARVSSNGCTAKDFIGADVRKLGESRFSVGFYREKEDFCRALLPEGVALTWSFAELGIPDGAEVKVRNPVGN